MGFTRLSSVSVIAAKGRWATMMHGALQAATTAHARHEAVAPRAAGSANGKASLAKNKATLAAALANTQANNVARASGSRATPQNSTTNRACLAAVLADNC